MPDVVEIALIRRARSLARCLPIVAIAAFTGCATRPHTPESVTIVADPGRFGTVERAAAAEDSVDWWDGRDEDDRACTESFAAMELARFLPAAFGLDASRVHVVSAGPLHGKSDVVIVGDRAARAAGIGTAPPTAKTPDAFRISTSRREGRTVVVISGERRTGTLTGAYGLLGKLGARFYDLGDSNAVMPRVPATLSSKLGADEAPAFTTRGFWAWEPRGSTDFFLWMARNRMNLWTAAEPRAPFLEKLGIRLTAGGHGIESEFLDPSGRAPGETRTRFQLHPEWYGLENGKRSPDIHGESGLNFCTSNHAAVAELARGISASLRGGSTRHADVLELWPLDGGRWCQCDSCRAIGLPQDRWLRVVAEVKQDLAAAERDGRLARSVEIVSPAYLETSTAPTRPVDPILAKSGSSVTFFPYFRCYAHALADPACEIVNAPIESRLRSWTGGAVRPYDGELGIGEYYNVSWTKSLPFVHPHVMAADLRDWSAHGITHFTTMHAPTRLWGTWTFEHAMLARLLWNPHADVDSLIGDFCNREYGDAGGDLRTFYRALELATANLTALQHAVGSIGFGESTRLLDPRVPIFRLRHLSDAPPPGIVDSSTTLTGIETSLAAARAALDAGRARTHDPRVAARLAEVDARFRYGDAMLGFWIALIRAAEAAREDRAADLRAQMAVADSAAARLRTVGDLVQVAASHANARDGLEASGATGVYEKLRTIAARVPR